ncbi:MAG: OmpA family protein [Formivibrio sp.]|nr:OmpA family protein [Formivibrio sp.]
MMKKTQFTPVLLAMAVLVAACSSAPTTTSTLEQTRGDYLVAQNNPQIASYAQLEMKQATDALNAANTAASKNDSADKINGLAYIAKQKIALAQEVASKKSSEVDIASANTERDRIRLQQRTGEADRAKMDAEQSKLLAQAAFDDAAKAQNRTKEAQQHSAMLEAQLADLSAKKTARGMIITLGDVLFGTDQAILNPEGMRSAQKLADILQQNPQLTVQAEGFTDSTGTSSYNQELSVRRAAAVRNALQGMGIAQNRVAIRGFGETFPVATNDTNQNRQLNRRVEMVLSDDNGKIQQR